VGAGVGAGLLLFFFLLLWWKELPNQLLKPKSSSLKYFFNSDLKSI
jgi:hypothetical protein